MRADPYPRDAFEHLAALEPGHFWFEARNQLIQHLLQTHAPHARSFLEVGCGTGFVLQHLAQNAPHLDLHAVEYHPEALPIAQRRAPRAHLQQGDARHLPFQDAFDVIGCFDVLEHIPEDLDALHSMRQALRPGGLLLLSVPQHPWLWSHADDLAHHQRRYTRADLLDKAQRAGLLPRDVSSFAALLLPLIALRTLLPPPPTAHQAPELRPHPLLNATLRALLDLEHAARRAGAPYPLGGSLFATLQRPTTS